MCMFFFLWNAWNVNVERQDQKAVLICCIREEETGTLALSVSMFYSYVEDFFSQDKKLFFLHLVFFLIQIFDFICHIVYVSDTQIFNMSGAICNTGGMRNTFT